MLDDVRLANRGVATACYADYVDFAALDSILRADERCRLYLKARAHPGQMVWTETMGMFYTGESDA